MHIQNLIGKKLEVTYFPPGSAEAQSVQSWCEGISGKKLLPISYVIIAGMIGVEWYAHTDTNGTHKITGRSFKRQQVIEFQKLLKSL